MKIIRTEAWSKIAQVEFVIKKYKNSLWKSMVLVKIRTEPHPCIKSLNYIVWLAWPG